MFQIILLNYNKLMLYRISAIRLGYKITTASVLPKLFSQRYNA